MGHRLQQFLPFGRIKPLVCYLQWRHVLDNRGQIKTLTAAAGLNQAGTLNGIVGSNDTPALVVNNNFLYCIHRGGNSWNDGGYLDGLQT